METAGIVAIALFMIGVVYGAGRLTVRVEKLEEWRGEVLAELRTIHHKLDAIARMIRGEES